MQEIKIITKIKNKTNPYLYEGIGFLNKDIISYSEKNSKTIYDRKMKRLIRKDNEKELRIDFIDKKIFIFTKIGDLTFDIDVIELYSNEELTKIKYKIDCEEIEFSIRIEKGDNYE